MGITSEIVLRFKSIDQCLISLESPVYGKRRLNKEIEELIIEEAMILPAQNEVSVRIYIPAQDKNKAGEIEDAFRQHFAYRKKRADRIVKDAVKQGWKSLFIAVIFLAIIFLLLEISKRLFGESGLPLTVREFLIILGWVALWKPADMLLYEWRPFKRESRLFGRLEKAKVIVS